ncbi:MAG: MBOAT family O-acyltransferase [Ruthenibacterium sp.]
MNFISLAFFVFLASACLVYFVLPKAVRTFWLLACSYLFYLYNPQNAGFIVLLLGTSAITYLGAILLDVLHEKSIWLRRGILFLALLACLGSLVYYKYTGFLSELFSGLLLQFGVRTTPPKFDIAVPLGISYFTFMAMGYLLDVHRGKNKAERNFLYVALFLSFFPCIVAGPIERADHLLPQFQKQHTFDYNRVAGGLFRVAWGCFKKLVIANTIGGIVHTVYKYMGRYDGPTLLLASLLFSYQLYIDFSALSDIAIGSGAVFGFTIMENFKRPLAASTFSDLWRRWHISLSSWFRDYIYIPLGGNRKGKLRAHANQLIVFAISGLWHGASIGYLIWGLLNGVYLCIGKETAAIRAKINARNPLYKLTFIRNFIGACITYLLFTSCIVFFCAEINAGGVSDALYVYTHLFTGWDVLFVNWSGFVKTLVALGFNNVTTFVLLGSVFVVEGMEYVQTPMNKLIRQIPMILRWALYYALILMIGFFGVFGQSSFIYQKY